MTHPHQDTARNRLHEAGKAEVRGNKNIMWLFLVSAVVSSLHDVAAAIREHKANDA